MSNSQKEALRKLELWAYRGFAAAAMWMISEMYFEFKTEFKELKTGVQVLKENDRAQTTAIEFLKDQVKAK
jgi:hypothetical protein